MINTCSVRERAEEKLFTRLGEIHHRGPRRRARGRSSRSPAASRSRKGPSCSGARPPIDVVIGTQNIRRLPMLVDEAVGSAPVARSSISPRWTTCRFRSGWRGAPIRQGLRHDHRRLQRVLRLLRGAVHARPRADAPGRRHPGRRAAGGRHRRPRDPAARADRQSLPGARRPGVRLRGAARAAQRHRRARAHPLRQPAPAPRHAAHDRGAARPPEGLPAPAPAGAVRLDAACSRRCAGATRARSTSSWSTGCATAMPDVALSTDMIVGFPGETDADFDDTLSLTAAVALPQHVLVQVLDRGRTRWRSSGCQTT